LTSAMPVSASAAVIGHTISKPSGPQCDDPTAYACLLRAASTSMT
jgi:hypothetical protein